MSLFAQFSRPQVLEGPIQPAMIEGVTYLQRAAKSKEPNAALIGAASAGTTGAVVGGALKAMTKGAAKRGAAGAAIGLLSKGSTLRGIGRDAALYGAGGAAIGGGSAAIGSAVMGEPEADDPLAYAKRGAVGGTIGGGIAGSIGALLALKSKKGAAFLKRHAKTNRVADAIVKGGPLAAIGIGGTAGSAAGAYQGFDEGQGVDTIRNSIRSNMKRLEAILDGVTEFAGGYVNTKEGVLRETGVGAHFNRNAGKHAGSAVLGPLGLAGGFLVDRSRKKRNILKTLKESHNPEFGKGKTVDPASKKARFEKEYNEMVDEELAERGKTRKDYEDMLPKEEREALRRKTVDFGTINPAVMRLAYKLDRVVELERFDPKRAVPAAALREYKLREEVTNRDKDRGASNYTKAAVWGGLAGAAIPGKRATLVRSAIGSGAGVLGVAATRGITDQTRDAFGDRSWEAKRAEEIPAALAVGAGLAGLGSRSKRIKEAMKAAAKKVPFVGKNI